MPRDAPVTTATFPRRPSSIVPLPGVFLCCGRCEEYSMGIGEASRSAHVPAKWEPVRRQEHAPLYNSCGRSNNMDLGIKGRRAIVTGGSSGIGFETARLFLEEGVRVLITGRNADKLEKARGQLAKTGGEMYALVADMSKEDNIRRMVDSA